MHIRLNILILCALVLCFACTKQDSIDADGFGLKLVYAENYNLRANFLDFEGNTIVASVGNENERGVSAYGVLPAVMYKLKKQNGGLMWSTDLPEIIHNLWKAIPLSNGNICVVGMDSSRFSQNVGLVVLSADGEILHHHSFFQQLENAAGGLNASKGVMDCIQLNNGSIALLTKRLLENQYKVVQIFEFDQQLNLVSERIYPDTQAPFVFSIFQDQNDFIYFLSGDYHTSELYAPNIFKVDGGSLELVSSTPLDSLSSNTSNLLNTSEGNIMWFSSKRDVQVYLRNQERYFAADTLLLSHYQIDSESMSYKSITGFPNKGYVTKIIPSSQGGYIAVGTCNVVESSVAVSRFRILLIKLDFNLNVEWIEDIDAQYTSILGQDITEIPGGYQIGATHFSISGFNMPILLRTDYSGQLY